MGSVIPGSQVTTANNAIRAAALAGCSITLSDTATYNQLYTMVDNICTAYNGNWGAWITLSTSGSFSVFVDATGVATITRNGNCSGTQFNVNSVTLTQSNASCTRQGVTVCGMPHSPGPVSSGLAASFDNEPIGGTTYRGRFRVGTKVAYCPNTFTLPAWEAAYIAP